MVGRNRRPSCLPTDFGFTPIADGVAMGERPWGGPTVLERPYGPGEVLRSWSDPTALARSYDLGMVWLLMRQCHWYLKHSAVDWSRHYLFSNRP